MKKNICIVIFLLISFVSLKLNTYAVAGSVDTYKTYYDKGITSISVNGTQVVTLYGKSVCDGSKCDVSYAGNYSNFKEVLKKSIVCTNGENNIYYQVGSSGKTGLYDSTNSQNNFNGTIYWAEEYNVTCTNEKSGNTIVEIEKDNTANNNSNGSNNGTVNDNTSNNSNGSNNGTVNDNTSNNSNESNNGTVNDNTSNNSNGSNNGNYNSSSTIENSQTGVNTYFVVLGIVAIISYLFMVVIRKYNLFKNI